MTHIPAIYFKEPIKDSSYRLVLVILVLVIILVIQFRHALVLEATSIPHLTPTPPPLMGEGGGGGGGLWNSTASNSR